MCITSAGQISSPGEVVEEDEINNGLLRQQVVLYNKRSWGVWKGVCI